MNMLATSISFVLISCGSEDAAPAPVIPDVNTVTFVAGISNDYFPLPAAGTWVYEVNTDEGLERIEVKVLDPATNAKVVNGVDVVVVEDKVSIDGEVVEYTHDWYAEDSSGNVWYLGENTCEFDPGTFDPDTFSFDDCTRAEGAWEWNVDGALPGYQMPANPVVDGKPYYQEYYVGQAEDVGEVVEVGVSVTTPAGSFDDCIKTHDSSTLDPELDEFKYYCPKVGTVLVEESDVAEELIDYSL